MLESAATLTTCTAALGALCTHRYSLQWLRHEGADWPDELQYNGYVWPNDMIAWCRNEGCDSPLGPEVAVDNAAIVDQA
eukprot:5748-Heterococcus_DN1.PRE.7